MKGKLLIIFKSSQGYVKRYVDILGNALGCDAVPVEKFKPYMLAGYDKYLYIGSLRGGVIQDFKKINDYLDAIYDKLAVCAVGFTPFSKERCDAIKDATVSVTYEKFLPLFYAQGGFDMEELTRTEKMQVAMAVRQIKASSVISDAGTAMINAVATPVDEVRPVHIQPLIDHLEGRKVDEALYSPAEISDPEERKKFFEELEAAANAPADKKKALKKTFN